jgi:hypothetical protein
MKTKLSLLATGMLLAAVNAGFSQPVITNQPGTLATALGTTATFTVGARGSGPLAYQWQKNLSDLPGRRDASLALTNVQFSDQADYRVVVSDTGGSVTSAAARLYVMSFTAVTSRVVVDSFDDNRLTGWTSYVGGTRIETNQQLTVRGYWPGVITYDPPSTAADAFLPRNWSVSDGQTLEWRVDLVGMNQGATAVILELLNSTWDGVYLCSEDAILCT